MAAISSSAAGEISIQHFYELGQHRRIDLVNTEDDSFPRFTGYQIHIEFCFFSFSQKRRIFLASWIFSAILAYFDFAPARLTQLAGRG